MATKQSSAGFSRQFTGLWLLLGVALFMSAGCGKLPEPAAAEAKSPVTVFAASSATEAIEELAAKFKAAESVPVRTSFAGSSTLAQQIMACASGRRVSFGKPGLGRRGREKRQLSPGGRICSPADSAIVVPADSKLEIESLADLASAVVTRVALGG